MSRSIEPYIRPNISRLEQWREDITTMRRLQWLNHKIAEWLDNEKGLKVSGEAVRKFCKVRGIKKGVGKPRPPLPALLESQKHRNPLKKSVFNFTDDGPIEIEGR